MTEFIIHHVVGQVQDSLLIIDNALSIMHYHALQIRSISVFHCHAGGTAWIIFKFQ